MDQNDVGVAIHASFSSAKALARTAVLPHAAKLKHILSSSVDLQNTSRRDASANGGKRKGEIFLGGGLGDQGWTRHSCVGQMSWGSARTGDE